MSTPRKLKKGDTVLVTSGKSRGKTGLIERVIPKSRRVIVTGVGKFKKRLRRTRLTPAGGTVEAFAAIDMSNVLVICKNCSKPTRVKMQVGDTAVVRVCRHCGATLDQKMKS